MKLSLESVIWECKISLILIDLRFSVIFSRIRSHKLMHAIICTLKKERIDLNSLFPVKKNEMKIHPL